MLQARVRGGSALTLLALAGLLAAPAGTAEAPARRPAAAAPQTLASFSESLQAVVERVAPAVVQVATTGYPAPAGAAPGTRERGSGSGVVLDPDGYVVTNAHVVQGAGRIQVVLPPVSGADHSIVRSRGRVVGATLVGQDEETDLAVLKLDAQGLPALTLGDSESLRQGQVVLALGSPFGLENTVTVGVVSTVARQLQPEDPMIYVQTDASINPGSSGGPLVDLDGRVVGINTLMLSQSGGNEGVGLAAPSNIVRAVYQQIKATGRVRRSEIGARTQTVTATLAAGLGLPGVKGVLVSDVVPRGPAQRAGLELGDLILKLDGKPMENARQFKVNVYARAPETTVTLEVWREGRTLEIKVPVAERADDPAELRTLVDPERNKVARLGLLGLDLEPEILERLPRLRAKAGVLVAAPPLEGIDWQDPLQPGDVIYRANGQAVTGLADLRALVAALPKGAPLALLIERRGALQYVGVNLD